MKRYSWTGVQYRWSDRVRTQMILGLKHCKWTQRCCSFCCSIKKTNPGICLYLKRIISAIKQSHRLRAPAATAQRKPCHIDTLTTTLTLLDTITPRDTNLCTSPCTHVHVAVDHQGLYSTWTYSGVTADIFLLCVIAELLQCFSSRWDISYSSKQASWVLC